MAIWPPVQSKSFLKEACKRACKCVMDVQIELKPFEIVKDKSLSEKIGIEVRKLNILFLGGIFKRWEYLCVGEGIRKACETETHSNGRW